MRLPLVDDDPFDAEPFAHHLRRAGLPANVERVTDDAAFRAALAQGAKPDLVLANVVLPAFGALEALAILRAAHADIPLIAMAAVTREEAIVDALRAGAVDYLFKNQLARLPLQLVTAQENERKRLARGLHDELGQRLTVLNMLL